MTDPLVAAFLFCEKYGFKNSTIHKDGTITVNKAKHMK